jgi:hypothetical protein
MEPGGTGPERCTLTAATVVEPDAARAGGNANAVASVMEGIGAADGDAAPLAVVVIAGQTRPLGQTATVAAVMKTLSTSAFWHA